MKNSISSRGVKVTCNINSKLIRDSDCLILLTFQHGSKGLASCLNQHLIWDLKTGSPFCWLISELILWAISGEGFLPFVLNALMHTKNFFGCQGACGHWHIEA